MKENQKQDNKGKIFDHKHNRKRDDITQEYPGWDAIQLVIFIIFSTATILDAVVFKFSVFLSLYIPAWIRIVFAIIFAGLGIFMIIKGLKTIFNEIRDPPVVITTGLFSRSRHPVYLGAMFLYIASSIASLSIIATVLTILICIFYDQGASYEENQLIQKFGDEYESYMKKVPKWISRL